jgi:Holliday junction resolvase
MYWVPLRRNQGTGRNGTGSSYQLGGGQVTTPQKSKGSQWERDIAKYFNDRGFPEVERRYGAGATLDKGDINGVKDTVVEAKNWAKISLSTIMDETIKEQQNAKKKFGIAVIKRRNKNVKDAYVMMTLQNWIDLYSIYVNNSK